MKQLFRVEREGFMASGHLSSCWQRTLPSGTKETQVFGVGITKKGKAVLVAVQALWFAFLMGWRKSA